MAEPLPNGFVGNFPTLSDDWGDDVNDNMRKWATITQLSVESMSVRTPPRNDLNLVYIVPTNPYGVWSQFAKQIVFWNGSVYVRYIPTHGLQAYDRARNLYYKFVGDYPTGTWQPVMGAVWCRRYLGTQQVIGGSNTNINLTSAESGADALGLYNTSGKYLRIPEAGIYDIRLHAQNIFDGTGGITFGNAEFYIYKGNTRISRTSDYSDRDFNHTLSHNCQYLGQFNAGDQVYFIGRAVSSQTAMIALAGLDRTYFDCKKVGE